MENLSLYDVLVGGFRGDDLDEDQFAKFKTMDDEEKLRTSISDNLKMILQTRQGSVAHLPDYGLPDVLQVYFEHNESMEPLKKLIRDIILKYEPRIADVRIRKHEFDQNNMRIKFHIRAKIKAEDGSERPEFLFTEFSSSGPTEVLLGKQES